jgi:AraC-like DNA-binding protein
MPKIKISEMTPEQQEAQRIKWREEKRLERAEQREQRREAELVSADEWSDEFRLNFPEHVKMLDAYEKEFSNKVAQEIGLNLNGALGNEHYALNFVARSLFGLKRGWIKHVCGPRGITGDIVSGSYFIDGGCGDIVEYAYEYGLKQSPTFAAAFLELLKMLEKRYGNRHEDAVVIRAELAGTYVPPQPRTGT